MSSATQLLAHFDRVVEAPDSLPRLRRFILDLAVRGKLVEQNAADEPASELLVRIQAEKDALVKSGKLKNVDPIEKAQDNVPPADFPSRWALVPFGVVVNSHVGGGTPSKSIPSYWEGSIPWASVKDVGRGKYLDDTIDRISEAGLANSSSNFVEPGSLIVVTRMGLGKVSINRVSVAINQDLRALRLSSLVSIDYCYSFFKTHSFQGSGLTVKGIKIEELLATPFPLPPLAEQQRIVAKVDELMALCDELEAAQQERERLRDCLAAASLQRLNQPSDTDSLETRREHVRFHLQHLTRLTTRPELIKALRQTIRNLAVQGLIIPQRSNPESALSLLDAVRKEKARLLKADLIPKEKTAKDAAVLRFTLPMGWRAVRLGQVCNLVTSGSRGWGGFYAETGPKFLRAQNIRFGRLRLDEVACVNPPAKSEGARTQVQRGDLLIVITGAGVTNPALLDEDLGEAYVSQHVALVRPTDSAMSRWLLLCLMAEPGGRAELVQRAYGSGKPGLNLDNIRSLNVPIPPLAEQTRIVAKVDELVAMCDELEAQLRTSQVDSSRLLSNLLDRILGVTRVSKEEKPYRALSASPISDHQKEEAPRYMTSNPAMTVDQIIGCVDDLGGTATPERLLKQSGLSEDLETFYDLLRAARDCGALVAPLGSDEAIRRPNNAY